MAVWMRNCVCNSLYYVFPHQSIWRPRSVLYRTCPLSHHFLLWTLTDEVWRCSICTLVVLCVIENDDCHLRSRLSTQSQPFTTNSRNKFFIVSDEILSAFMDSIKLSHSICICKFVGKNVFVLYWVSKNYTWSRLFCIFLVVFFSIMTRMCRALISRILTLTQRVSSRPSDTNVINMQLISKCSFHGHRAYYLWLNYTLLQYVYKKLLWWLLFQIWVNFMLLQHLIAYSINKWNTDGIWVYVKSTSATVHIHITFAALTSKKKKRQNFNYSIWKQNTSSVHLAVFRFLNPMKSVFFPTFSIFNNFYCKISLKSRDIHCITSSWING